MDDFSAMLLTKLSRRRVARIFEKLGWQVRKCSWTNYEVESPFAELVIEAESPILMHGLIDDALAKTDRIFAPLRQAGIGYTGEIYDSNGELIGEIHWKAKAGERGT